MCEFFPNLDYSSKLSKTFQEVFEGLAQATACKMQHARWDGKLYD